MISSSDSWRAGARSWLAAPCTYTTAKCLSNRVQALQVGRSPQRRSGARLTWMASQPAALLNQPFSGPSEGAGRLGADPVGPAGFRRRSEGNVAGL